MMLARFFQRLTSEAVNGSALSLQSVDDIHCCDGLSLGVFGVRDRISDNIIQEHLQHTASLFLDQARDALDTTMPCQTTNGFVMPWMLSRNTLQ
jgi:hypothetical protein